MTTFDDTTLARRIEGSSTHEIDLHPSWSSMNGILGGAVTAVVARAAAHHAPERSLRTVATNFLRSTRPGPATITVETIRVGRSLTTLHAEVHQEGQRTATTRLTYLAPVQGESWETSGPPALAPRAQCVPIDPPEAALHFVHATGVLDPAYEPFSHGPLARVAGYVRPLEPRPVDAPWLAMILDWFPPSPFTSKDPPIGGTSIDYTVHVHRTLPALAEDDWLSGEFQTDISTAGLALERGTVRGPDGQILAESFHTRWTAS